MRSDSSGRDLQHGRAQGPGHLATHIPGIYIEQLGRSEEPAGHKTFEDGRSCGAGASARESSQSPPSKAPLSASEKSVGSADHQSGIGNRESSSWLPAPP